MSKIAHNKGRWTRFMDMHSGGGQKEKFAFLHIEAPEKEATVIFYNRFGHNPDRVTCTCCGSDYSISEYESLEQSSAFDRGCAWDSDKQQYVEHRDSRTYAKEYQTLPQYLKREDVAVIYAKDIKPKERKGDVPQEGYVWM